MTELREQALRKAALHSLNKVGSHTSVDVYAYINELEAQNAELIAERDAASTFALEWWAAPRPPVHPTKMRGRQSFPTLEKAVAFMASRAPDSEFIILTEIIERRVDRSAAIRALKSDNKEAV